MRLREKWVMNSSRPRFQRLTLGLGPGLCFSWQTTEQSNAGTIALSLTFRFVGAVNSLLQRGR
jgi:hypothetical protein